MVKNVFKLLLSITAFAWAVYPAEVGESDEDIMAHHFRQTDTDNGRTSDTLIFQPERIRETTEIAFAQA